MSDSDQAHVAVSELLDHLDLSEVDAVVATLRPDETADAVVALLEAGGWTLDRVEYVAGKRIRHMRAP